MTISVIIPAYNEERTIASVVDTVVSWGKATEIIVVNDGSTDRTIEAIAQFKKNIILVNHKENHGKGYAIVKGIRKATGDIVLFLDADLLGLTRKDVDDLVAPIESGRADMAVRGAKQQMMRLLSGERAMRRTDVLEIADKMKSVGYGMELLLTNFYKNKRVVYVDLPFVSPFLKYEKHAVNDAMVSYIKEARELVTQAIRQQTDELTPQARRVYQTIALYLKQALDYF